MSDTVVRVELVYYDQPNVRELSDFFGNAHRRHLDFDFSLMTYLETMEDGNKEYFFQKLSETYMHNPIQQRNSPSGLAILIHYKNGNFDVISSDYVGRFDKEGRFVEYLSSGIGNLELSELIEQHFSYSFE